MHCSVDVDDVVGNDEPDSGSGLLAAREAWRRLTTLMRLSDPVRHFWRAPALLALG